MSGNCLNRDQCLLSHPDMKLKKKSKLKFKQTQEYIPEFKVRQKRNEYSCECCRGNPYNCKSPFCKEMGACICQEKNTQPMKDYMEGFENVNLEICSCCKGNFNQCQAVLCNRLGICQCQMRQEMETNQDEYDDEINYFVSQNQDCNCCRGFVFACKGEKCKNTCFCFM